MSSHKKIIVGIGSRLDNFQTGLDVIGMTEIPFVSQCADLGSGVISLATGDYVGAALSVGGLIPGIGQATGTMKIARRAGKVLDTASNVKGIAKQTDNFFEQTGKSIKTSQTKTKQATTNKSEVNAKSAKKEDIREKEDITADDVNNKDVVKKHLDIRDGVTNQLEGQTLERAISQGLPKSVQKGNFQRASEQIKQIEQGKPFYNPTNGMGKESLWNR